MAWAFVNCDLCLCFLLAIKWENGHPLCRAEKEKAWARRSLKLERLWSDCGDFSRRFPVTFYGVYQRSDFPTLVSFDWSLIPGGNSASNILVEIGSYLNLLISCLSWVVFPLFFNSHFSFFFFSGVFFKKRAQDNKLMMYYLRSKQLDFHNWRNSFEIWSAKLITCSW